MSSESVIPSSHLILCHSPLLLPSIFASIRVFSNESALCTRWPKFGSFSFSMSPSSEYSGLISFRTDSFDLLAVQATLKSLLWHHSSKASVLQCSAFFTVQLSHLYMTTRKTIALTIGTFVSRVMSLLFNTLSRFVIAWSFKWRLTLGFWLMVFLYTLRLLNQSFNTNISPKRCITFAHTMNPFAFSPCTTRWQMVLKKHLSYVPFWSRPIYRQTHGRPYSHVAWVHIPALLLTGQWCWVTHHLSEGRWWRMLSTYFFQWIN